VATVLEDVESTSLEPLGKSVCVVNQQQLILFSPEHQHRLVDF
jgi:hypothetical protein